MSYLYFVVKQLLLILVIACVLAEQNNPQTVKWSSKSYGPDGPWQAVTVYVGSPPQTVDLLPGGSWMSNVLAPTVCANGVACDVAKLAGFYNPSASSTTFEIGQTGDISNASMAATVGALPSLYGSANWMFDSISIPLSNGISGNGYNALIIDFDLLVISAANEKLPDGTTYPVQIGKLGLGAPNFNQTWNHFPPNPNWNGTLLPSALFEQGLAPSDSYGMHIGSAAMGIPGSLNIGGFDQSRALEPVSSQAYVIDHLPIDLLDIGIGVAEGASPFNFTSQSGLLAEGNSSMGVATSVFVEAPVPYLYLPQSTCDAITKYLPVTFQEKYGLYFWNTEDPDYKRIVSSPSFLSFTFRFSGSLSQNMTINVPFSLLNLTLTAPIISTPTQYLPLRPGQGPNGAYELGRAFLQAAFIGVNWRSATGSENGVWFIAQAPGPNTPSENPATVIGAEDATIVGSTNTWKDSWHGAWTVLESSTTGGAATPTSSTSPSPGPHKSGLSTGAIVGIVVGVLALALIVVLVAVFIYKRSHAAKEQSPEASGMDIYNDMRGEPGPREPYKSSGFGPSELETGYIPRKPIEMAG
jgi:hypothetical protein